MDFEVALEDDVLYLFMGSSLSEYKCTFKLTKDNIHEIKDRLCDGKTLYFEHGFMFVFEIEHGYSTTTFIAYPEEKDKKNIRTQLSILENLLTSYIENLDEHIVTSHFDFYEKSSDKFTNMAKNCFDRYINFLESLSIEQLTNLDELYLEHYLETQCSKTELIKMIIEHLLEGLENEMFDKFNTSLHVSITSSIVENFFKK